MIYCIGLRNARIRNESLATIPENLFEGLLKLVVSQKTDDVIGRSEPRPAHQITGQGQAGTRARHFNGRFGIY